LQGGVVAAILRAGNAGAASAMRDPIETDCEEYEVCAVSLLLLAYFLGASLPPAIPPNILNISAIFSGLNDIQLRKIASGAMPETAESTLSSICFIARSCIG
jgi:hypothetical protein